MIVAIIPARGGSKRLPRKNILPFGGRPLISWSIAAAKACPSIDQVWVTTEDQEIAAISAQCGAKVVCRPHSLACDDTSTFDVVKHCLKELRERGLKVDTVIVMQPTNPLRPVSFIEEAILCFMSKDCDSLISVSQRPLKTGHIHDGYFYPSYEFGQQSRLMSALTYENGLLYITKSTLVGGGTFLGDQVYAYLTPRPFDEVDIDDADDFLVGEAIAQIVRSRLGY